jgi:hypothetical protein
MLVRKDRKLKDVSVAPGPSSDMAKRCTELARRALGKVLRALMGDTCNFAGVESVNFRFLCDCQTVIAFADTAATMPVAFKPVHQPSLSQAAATNFAHLNRLLWELCALSAVQYTIGVMYKGFCFTLEPVEDPTKDQVAWASAQHAKLAASMNRPVYSVAEQQEARVRQAQRDLDAQRELLRRSNEDLKATRMALAMANQTVMRLEESPLEPDAAHLQGPSQATLTHPNQSSLPPMYESYLPMYLLERYEPVAQQDISVTQLPEHQAWYPESCWQAPARAMHPGVAQHHDQVYVMEQESEQQIGVPFPGLAAWGGVDVACNDRNGPWFMPRFGPSLSAEAPISDKSPFESDHTICPGLVPPVQAALGDATTLPKRDFSLDRVQRPRQLERLTRVQMAALSSWHDKNSSSENPYPSLSAEIISKLQQETVSCAQFMRRMAS